MDYRHTIEQIRALPFADIRRIASEAGLHINTLLAIKNGQTDDPRLSTVEKVAALLPHAE